MRNTIDFASRYFIKILMLLCPNEHYLSICIYIMSIFTWDLEIKLALITNISYSYHVLTVETNKISWRRIECGTPHSPSSGTGLCISGVLYYRASEAFSNASMIVCFDVRSEKYKFIRVRESSMGAVHPITTLINYNGKLASLMVERYYIYAEAIISFDMWVLQDPGKQEWSKHTCKFLIRGMKLERKSFTLWVWLVQMKLCYFQAMYATLFMFIAAISRGKLSEELKSEKRESLRVIKFSLF